MISIVGFSHFKVNGEMEWERDPTLPSVKAIVVNLIPTLFTAFTRPSRLVTVLFNTDLTMLFGTGVLNYKEL